MKKITLASLLSFILMNNLLSAERGPLTDDAVILDGPEAHLTVGDLKKVLKALPGNVVGPMLQLPRRLREVIDQTYLVMVAADRARKAGLEKDPVFQAKVENYRRNLLAGMEADRYVEANMPEEATLEELAREEYLAHLEKYRQPEQVHARHILIRVAPGEDDAKAKARIEAIRQEIQSGRIDFETAARKYSQDRGSAAKGGDLGFFPKGRMVKSFEKAAFALESGQLSEPVRSPFGWHLILVEAKKPARQIPFEQLKKRLVDEQRKKVKKELRQRFWVQLRDDPANKINQPLMDRLMKNPGLLYGQEKLPTPASK